MFFSVNDLEMRKIHFDVEIPSGEIEYNEEGVKQTSPLRAEGSAEILNNTLGEIRVRGKLAVQMELVCDRCLDPVPYDLATDFDLFYRPAEEGAPVHHEVALDAGESEIGFYEDGGVELEDVLREHILLSLPMHRVCREECGGICPSCGQNRNNGTCHCETKPADDRWAALRELRSALTPKN